MYSICMQHQALCRSSQAAIDTTIPCHRYLSAVGLMRKGDIGALRRVVLSDLQLVHHAGPKPTPKDGGTRY
jgi:hypothetical protein